MSIAVEHINIKERLIELKKSNLLELVPILHSAINTFKFRFLYRCIGEKTIIGRKAEIINFSNVIIGSHCLVLDHAYIRAGSDGKVVIGDYSAINSFVKIFGHGGISIGNYTQIGPGCLLTTTTHNYNENLETQFKPITIGKRVWVGAKSVILPDVSIGDFSVIGAGSIVNRSIPSNSVAVGNPARIIKRNTIQS